MVENLYFAGEFAFSDGILNFVGVPMNGAQNLLSDLGMTGGV